MAEDKKATAESVTSTSSGLNEHEVASPQMNNTPPDAIGQLVETMRMNLQINRTVKSKQVVEVLQTVFPGFDAALLSKVMNREKYGASLSPQALNVIAEHYPQLFVANNESEE